MSQLSLFQTPEEQGVEPVLCRVSLASIDAPGDTPSPQHLASVRDLGVLEAVTLVRRGDRYRVVLGRRRVEAAIRSGRDSIPALVYPETTDPYFLSAAYLASQYIRTSNPVAELQALESLCQENTVPLDVVAKKLRISLPKLQRLSKLKRLDRPLYQALLERKIALTTAERAVTLDAPRQQILVEKLQGGGKVTLEDVREARQVRRAEQASLVLDALPSAPSEFFSAPQPRSTASDGWTECIAALEAAARLLPSQAPVSLRDRLLLVLSEARDCAARPLLSEEEDLPSLTPAL